MKKERTIICFSKLLPCLTVIFILSLITACASNSIKKDEAKDGKIVARVNGQPIYEDQLTPEVEKSLRKFKKYGMRKDSDELINRLQRKALDNVIDNELIYQESMDIKINNLDKEIERRVQKIRDKYQTEGKFENYLKSKNLTIESLKESIKRKISIDEYLKQEGISEPEISEDTLKGFYDGNPKAYYRDETIKVSHILIKVDENAGNDEKEKALKKAEQIRKEILAGKDFVEMAKEHSECNSAPGGGSLGYIKKDYMPPEFDKVAFSMEKGPVSDVVETKFGYHIIKVIDKIPAGLAPYEEVRDFIKKYLQSDESKKLLSAKIAELKQKAKIEILLDQPQ